MATNTNLGGVFTTDLDGGLNSSGTFLSTENVVGLVFDTSIMGGLEKALVKDSAAYKNFANGQVVELNSTKDIAAAGIDDTVMHGLAQWHLNAFFALAGGNQRLFVSFMSSQDDSAYEAVEKMQFAANGIIGAIGVWTGVPIAKSTTTTDANQVTTTKVELNSSHPLAKLQAVAETLGGTIGVTNYEGNAPCNIIVNAPIADAAKIDYKDLPDLSGLNCPKVSFIIGQPATSEVHELMYAINTEESTYVPVGNIGMALGVIAKAPANKNIGMAKKYNLAAVAQKAELGFGNLVADAANKTYSDDSSFTNIDSLGYKKRNEYLHKKGYIFLTTLDGVENSVLFSSDQTLSTGDYRTIARCRVMHKARRVVRRALLEHVNEDFEVDTATGCLSDDTISALKTEIIDALQENMVEPGTKVPQISGKTCSIANGQNILKNDELLIEFALIPKGLTAFINCTEGFTSIAS